jgi:hypothetical protein
MTPCVVAETALVGLVAMPTSDAPGPLVSKNTRSPAWTSERPTEVPAPNWAKLVRGTEMPAWPMAQATRPEQSNAAPARERAKAPVLDD